MPKDEFDFEDPFELTGHALVTEEDTTEAMCECFVEEFIRLGHTPDRILALFRTPFYVGMHLVLQKRGELFVRERIKEGFARWGRPCCWPELKGHEETLPEMEMMGKPRPEEAALTDPLGGALPHLD
jgi:hypothetical protein